MNPGDEVVFSARESVLVPGEQCDPPCPPTLSARDLCNGHERTWVLDASQAWTVELSPGMYSVSLGAQFVGVEDVSGGLFVAFGLLVDASRERAVLPSESVDFDCASEMP